MKSRPLGNSGIEVAPLALGGNVFGWTADEPTSFAILDRFVDAGFNLIDTADMYSIWAPGHKGGESETVIGNWFARGGRRKQVVIATKVGMEISPTEKGLSKPYILRAVEQSLHRLQTDYIDLYQSHRDDEATPLDETLAAYDQLLKQGKVRAIGASNYSGSRLAEALRTSREKSYARYECLQPHYNLCERSKYEQELEPICREAGLAVIPYFSLAAGFLTGKYRSEADLSKSPRGQGIKKYLNERGFRILAALDEIAARLGATPGKVALAWLMARPSITAPIASATSLAQLEDLLDATTLELDASAMQRLNQASD
ncbi:MAG TPA: aldo/keto reductase [Planctomycetaceae bacterium]|jgi:aryl-alcohol dehydrogenase-like predicted oxidoreductase